MKQSSKNKCRASFGILMASALLVSGGSGYAEVNVTSPESIHQSAYVQNTAYAQQQMEVTEFRAVGNARSTSKVNKGQEASVIDTKAEYPIVYKMVIRTSSGNNVSAWSAENSGIVFLNEEDLGLKHPEGAHEIALNEKADGEYVLYMKVANPGNYEFEILNRGEVIGTIQMKAARFSYEEYAEQQKDIEQNPESTDPAPEEDETAAPDEEPGEESDSETENPGEEPGEEADSETENPGEEPGEECSSETKDPDEEPGEESGSETEKPGEEPGEESGSETENPGEEPGEESGSETENPDEEPGEETGTEIENPGDESGEESGSVTEEPGEETEEESGDQEKPEAALLEAKEKLTLAEQNLEAARVDLKLAEDAWEEASGKLEVQQAELETLQTQREEAAARFELAQTAHQAALAEYERALNEITESPEYLAMVNMASEQSRIIELAVQAADEAKNELDSSKGEYEEAAASVETIKQEKQDAEDKLAEAETVLQEKLELLDAAKLNVEQCNAADTEAKAAYEAHLAEVEAASAALSEAKEKVETIQAGMEEAKAAAEQAYLKYTDAVQAYEDAQKTVAQGSLGFFVSHATAADMYTEGQTIAERIYEVSAEVAGDSFKTEPGNEKDATSLENMKTALNRINEGNGLRVNDEHFPGLNELGVSDALMMLAEIEANQEQSLKNHWFNNIYAQNAEGRGYGENSAWYYRDPFTGWYDAEKAIYESQSSGQTGHYLNIVDKSYVATGFGTTGYTDVQDFAKGWNIKNFGQVYSFDEYYAAFMEYYTDVMTAVEETGAEAEAAYLVYQEAMKTADKGILEEAKNAYEAAAAEYEFLIGASAEMEKAVEDAEAAAAEAESALEQAENEAAEAQSTADEMQTVVDGLKDSLAEAEKTADEYADAVQTAEDRLKAANETVEKENAVLEEIQEQTQQLVQNEATAEIEAAKEVIRQTESEMTEAQNALEEAKEAEQEAMDAVARAEENAANAANDLSAAQERVESAEGTVETAAKAVEELENAN